MGGRTYAQAGKVGGRILLGSETCLSRVFSGQRDIPHPATLRDGSLVTGAGSLKPVLSSRIDNIFGRETEGHCPFFWPLVDQLRWVK